MYSRIIFMVTILLIASATQISSDIYIPSLMTISDQLQGATFNLAQISVSIFLFGVSITQLLAGPLSEGIGRKQPIMTGLVIMSIGSVICATSGTISLLIIGRFIQGLGAGALASLWRTVFRDVMSGEELAKYSSFISIFMILVVAIAPALGGYFETIGWRSSFIFMLGYTLILLIIVLINYKETGRHHHLERLKPHFIIKTYKSLLTSPIFMGITTCIFLSYGGLFSWIVLAPSLLMQKVGLTPIMFGWTISIAAFLSFSTAAWTNVHFIKHLGIPSMMRIGWIIMTGAGVLMLAGYYLFGITTWSIILPILLFYFGSALIWPNAFSAAFTPFGKIAGYTGSLYGFMQLLGGAIMGSLSALLPETDQRILAIVIITTSITSLLIYQFWVLPKSEASN